MTHEEKLRELETASYFGVLGYARSYTNVLYNFLTFPIGLALFIYAWVCLPLFIGLSVIVIVLPLLYAFLWTIPRIILVVGYLTELFVGLPVPTKDDIETTIRGNVSKSKKVQRGKVINYFKKVGTIEIELTSGDLKVGQTIIFENKNDFYHMQTIDSLRVDNESVQKTPTASSSSHVIVGLKVDQKIPINSYAYVQKTIKT